MNEQTTKLIEQLAAKLGTTTEHLWGVLLKQAPMSSGISATMLAVFLLVLILSARWLKRNELSKDDADDMMGKVLCWILWGVMAFMLSCFIYDSLPMIIAGFFNPEYWALKQIIK